MGDESEQRYTIDVVESVEEIDKGDWNSVVERADPSSLFHRYEWIAAVEAGLEHSPKHLLANKDSNLIGVYPNFEIEFDSVPVKRLTSLYPGFGGPVASTDKSKCFSLFSSRISDACSVSTLVHQIRAKEPKYLGYNNLLKTHGYRPTRDGCRFLLSLENGYDEVLDSMRRDRRRRFEQAHEENYELLEEELTERNLQQFYGVYQQAMDRVDGSTFPLSFLTELQRMESDVLMQKLRIDGEYAGGTIQLLNEDDSYIHGWLMAVDDAYFDNHASELLYDGVIQWGIENGYETYDMGYTPSETTDGLYNYKKSYGGELVPNYSWEKSCSPVWPLVRTGRGLYWSQVKSPPA